jgi:aspartate aminotransferase
MRKIRQSVLDAQYSVREISGKAEQLDDVVRFDIGQPDFDTPKAAKQAAKEAVDQHITYTSLWGIQPLRDEIAAYEGHKADFDGENVMVTTGGIGALFSIFSTLCEPGEKILFNDPCWMVYSLISNASTATFSQTPYFKDGKINKKGIRDAIDRNTKAIVINNPENPTGRVYSRDELETIIDIAAEHDLWVIGDEVYDHLTYGKEHVSVAEIAPERSIIVNSMSKNFAMTGWRIGWAACTHDDLIHQIGKLNRSTTACPNFIGQHAALAALQKSQSYVEEMRQQYQQRKQAIERHLDDMGLDYVDPDGAIYIFPNVGKDSWAFAEQLLQEAGVSVVPGEPCGNDSKQNIRICFGSVGRDDIDEGMQRLKSFLR